MENMVNRSLRIWYVIHFERVIKSQALVDFVAELNSPIDKDPPSEWALSLDEASNAKGSGVGILLEGLGDTIIEQELKFEFNACNNQSEYEAFISGMIFTLEMGATRLKAKNESH